MNNKMEGLKVADFHQDALNPRLAEILSNPELAYAKDRARQLPRKGLLELDLIFASIYRRINSELKAAALAGNKDTQDFIKQDLFKIIDYYRGTDDFRIIENPGDLKLPKENKTNAVLHLEGGDIITDENVIEELYARGVRSIGPVYSHDNQIGGGASGDASRGLTPFGIGLIDKMMRKGIIIDIAHANRKTAQDILERVQEYRKIAATHTGFGKKERFITPELLKEIAKRGGVIGFTPAKPFFPTLKDFIEGLKKASDITGSADHLAIGTDFGGIDNRDLYLELDEIGKLSTIAEKLSEDGRFTDEAIAKIMYGNIVRLVNELK
jgi:membrane dipeptidase